MVKGLYDPDHELRMNAYNMIKKELETSTASMTSIPKPLKFLRLHYEDLKKFQEELRINNSKDSEFKQFINDLLAVFVIVSPNTTDTSLSWVLTGSKKGLTTWGQEFIRNLSGDIATEFINRLDLGKSYDDLLDLVNVIVPYLIEQHSENEAIDLLLEVEKLDSIMSFVNEHNYKRVCLYLMATSNYAADTDELKSILEIAYNIYTKYNEHANALRVAIKMNNNLFITQTFFAAKDFNTQKQLAFILAKQRINITLKDDAPSELQTILSNTKLSEYYEKLGRSLDVLEPKHPEDIFKSHLEEKKGGSEAKIDSYKMNMASSIASAFINAGFKKEVLLSKEGSDWLSRNKDEGVVSLIAGLGMVNLWDIDCGPNELEKFMSSNEKDQHKRGGYNIGVGIISSGVKDENNVAFAILSEQLKDKK
jgi:26S proteasome regulatory subunit N1